jgi:methyl-accepting chemotaxis protein
MLVLTVLLVAGSITGISIWRAEAEAEKNAYNEIERNMRVAWADLKAIGTEYRIEGDKILAGNTVLNDLNALPDNTVSQVGGNATIFMGDTRVATNVKKHDGSRAVGTKLAKNAAHEAVFAGNSYRGVVDILGVPYITGYDPIKDAAGKVIGILFVGTKLDQFYAGIKHDIYWIVGTSAVSGFLIVLLALFYARRAISNPIGKMTDVMGVLAKGDLTVEIPSVKSSDEIGDMAEALRVFRTAA